MGVQAVVVDRDRLPTQCPGSGRVAQQPPIPRGRHHAQLLRQLDAHTGRRCPGPAGSGSRVDQDPVTGGQAGRERQQHAAAQPAVAQRRIQKHPSVLAEGERQIMAVPGQQRRRPRLQQRDPDRAGSLDLIGDHHIRAYPAEQADHVGRTRVEPGPVLRSRRRHQPEPRFRSARRDRRDDSHLSQPESAASRSGLETFSRYITRRVIAVASSDRPTQQARSAHPGGEVLPSWTNHLRIAQTRWHPAARLATVVRAPPAPLTKRGQPVDWSTTCQCQQRTPRLRATRPRGRSCGPLGRLTV